MSTTTASDTLDIREQIARIDRSIDEAAKFRAEQRKLSAEADKLQRDRFLAPFLAIGLLCGAVAGAVGALVTLLARGVH